MPKLPKTIRARTRRLSAKVRKVKKTAAKRWKKYCAVVAAAPLEAKGPGWKSPQDAAKDFRDRYVIGVHRAINPPMTTGDGLEHLTKRGWEALPKRKDGLYATRNPIRIVSVLVPRTVTTPLPECKFRPLQP